MPLIPDAANIQAPISTSEAMSHYGRLSGDSDWQLRFIGQCIRTSPHVGAVLLRRGWQETGWIGHGPFSSRYDSVRVLKWFSGVPRATLMKEEEQQALAALSNPVVAWRAAPGRSPRLASCGLAWTVDQLVARNVFVPRAVLRHGQCYLVEAEFPRSAVVAYFADQDESELILDWRQARKRRCVACFGRPITSPRL